MISTRLAAHLGAASMVMSFLMVVIILYDIADGYPPSKALSVVAIVVAALAIVLMRLDTETYLQMHRYIRGTA